MCRPFGTRPMSLILPGTAVPGYRLFRPCGTVSVAASIQALKPNLFQFVCGPTKVVP